MSPEQQELYQRLGKLAHFIRRRLHYRGTSLCTIDVQHLAWLKLMAGQHARTLEQQPLELLVYAQSVVSSILDDWRKAKHALKRGHGEVPLALDAAGSSSTQPIQVADMQAEVKLNQSWAGAWLTRELEAFIAGVSTATVKEAERRTQMARAYWLHFVAGCTHDEVASILELPNKQVAWRFVDFVDRHLRRCAQRELTE